MSAIAQEAVALLDALFARVGEPPRGVVLGLEDFIADYAQADPAAVPLLMAYDALVMHELHQEARTLREPRS